MKTKEKKFRVRHRGAWVEGVDGLTGKVDLTSKDGLARIFRGESWEEFWKAIPGAEILAWEDPSVYGMEWPDSEGLWERDGVPWNAKRTPDGEMWIMSPNPEDGCIPRKLANLADPSVLGRWRKAAPPKVEVTEERLGQAWKSLMHAETGYGVESKLFQAFKKELGL